MSDRADPSHREIEMIPRALARAMLILVLTVLALVSAARLTEKPLIATPPASPIVQEREILIFGDMSGAARVLSPDGTLIADLSPDQGGFISGVWRVIQRERAKQGAAEIGTVTVIRGENGRMSISDPSTGWSADLMAFGADNARAFAKLLAQQP